MRKLFTCAAVYAGVGLFAGLFYREFTKMNEFTGKTMLSVVHTHALALGMLVFLVVLALDKVFRMSAKDAPSAKLFTLFFWFYNVGLVITLAMLITHGIMQVKGIEASAAISGIAGLGHIGLMLGILHLFLALNKAMKHEEAGGPRTGHTVLTGGKEVTSHEA